MGYSGAEIIERFVEYAGKPHGREPGKRAGRDRERFPDGSGSSLYYSRDAQGRVVGIMSYGAHFPLAYLVLDAAGRRKRWLLNGDRWPGGGFVRTNEHNEMARELVQRTRTPWFTVPFSVIRESRIVLDTIVPVSVEPERYTWENHTALALDEVPEGYRSRRVWRDGDGQEITAPDADRQAWPDGNGGWYIQERSAVDGWKKVMVPGPAYAGSPVVSREEIEPAEDGLYHWETERHWLGESVFRATYITYGGMDRIRRTRYYLSAFDENEPVPSYFLAELPAGARPRTVAEAREALKPQLVRDAEHAGITVLRQGDIFAVEYRGPIPSWPSERGAYVLGTNHTATEVRRQPAGETYVRGILRHRPASRRPDHANVSLGDRKTWYRLVKNTVEMDANGRSRAWSISRAAAHVD